MLLSSALAMVILGVGAFTLMVTKVQSYTRGFAGQGKAVSDARRQALPQIRVEPIELQWLASS